MDATASGRGHWIPVAVGALLAAGMLWLAGDPLDPSGGGARAIQLPDLSLVNPEGEHAIFPTRFEWRAVRGADLYEITVTRADENSTLLFRQRGTTTVLDLDWDPGAEPPAGAYRWEVLATRNDFPIAIGYGSFRVTD